MNRGVFIAGTDTGVGKTRVCVALLQALTDLGIRAAGMKPVLTGLADYASTGVIADDTTMMMDDGRSLMPFCPTDCSLREVSPYRFEPAVSPHIAARRAGVTLSLSVIETAYRRLSQSAVVVVEGTGGWYAPIGAHTSMADIAMALQLPVVLVVGLRLGCLNHALLTAAAIERCAVPFAGWIGSVLDPQLDGLAENIQTLQTRLPAPQLGLLPHGVWPHGGGALLEQAATRLFGRPSTP